MSRNVRVYISIAVAITLLILLIWRTIVTPPHLEDLFPALLFVLLIVFTNTFGVPLGGGRVSLVPMTAVAAYLVLGLVPAGWVTLVGAALQEGIRYRWAGPLDMRREPAVLATLGLGAANVILQTGSVLVGGTVYRSLGGAVPLTDVSPAQIPPLLLLALTYLGINYLIAGVYLAARSRAALWHYLRSLPNLFLYEAIPLVFAPLMARIYTRLGIIQFALFAAILVASSLIIYNLSLTSRRLERRLKELGSLQAVGQALTASLDLSVILPAIHAQVGKLMPAQSFYVALYDPETEEVSFPLAIEDGRKVPWRSRRAGTGLTEYVLRTGKPLLIQENLPGTLARLGVEMIGRVAASWLGVPLLAGAEPLGVIAVQSYSSTEIYDQSHREVLMTIATQATVAIQNARLYARTDEALARRVQELASILQTTSEGLLLLDPEWRILAANRALADLLEVTQGDLAGRPLLSPPAEGERSVLALIEYTPEALQAQCEGLTQAERPRTQAVVTLGRLGRPVERTLTPVRDRTGRINGWLLVFRDLTEERELERMREELTHLLVHDLRSPLTVIKGGLDSIRLLLDQADREQIEQLLTLSQRSTRQMLRMVNELLDISRLESRQMPLEREAVEIRPLLEEVVAQFTSLAASAEVALYVSAGADLPSLQVDRPLISRVVGNLLDNAVKFTPDGGQVRLWARPASAGREDTVLLGVSDTGPGIPPEAQAQLFTKFTQVPSRDSRRRGSGLGLYFCKLVVEAHGGRIWVESGKGQGSTFVMQLPVWH